MKRNPDFNISEMIPEILASDAPVTAVGRETSAAESIEATASFKAALADFANKVKTVCIGCQEMVGISECAPCVCGGFVCAACQQVEEDGVCQHEKPSWLPDDAWQGGDDE